MKRLVRLALAAAVLLGLAVLGGPAAVRPTGQRLAIVEQPGDYGLRAETVTFAPPDRALDLRAWWIPGARPRAALVLVHGGGEDNRSLPYGGGLALARDLVARGYALLMLDLRNYGDSDGTPEGVTFGDLEANDVAGAVDFLATRAPALPVGAIGFSMGGATVLRAAARDPRVRAVVADSAFADARAVAVAFTRAATGLPTWLAIPFVWSAQHVHGTPLGRGATLDALRGATLPPVLVVQNVHDPIVPLADAERLAAAIPGAELWVTHERAAGPFGTHIKSYLLAPEAYVTRVAAFLDRALAAAGRDAGGARDSGGAQPPRGAAPSVDRTGQASERVGPSYLRRTNPGRIPARRARPIRRWTPTPS